MAEYDIHHGVHQLMKLIEVQCDPNSGISEELIADSLLKSVNQPSRKSNISKFIRKLESHANSDFKQIYENLKAKNIIEVDPLALLLARILENDDVKMFIRFHKIMLEKYKNTSNDQIPVKPTRLVDEQTNSPFKETDTNLHRTEKQHTPTQLYVSDANEEQKPAISQKRPNKKDTRKSDKKLNISALTYDYAPFDWSLEPEVVPLSKLSITDQSNALIHDLLYVLVGIEGRYIRRSLILEQKKFHLVVDDNADKLLRTLVERIITICPLYSSIVNFIENYDYGLVNQALISFMRKIVKDYFLLITQLENQHNLGDMTLQKMWYFLQDIYSQMEILKQVCLKIKQGKCIGGAVLSILHEKTMSHTGNVRASQFCMKMTSAACEPYFHILETWISEGIIYDEYKEFFIEDVTGGSQEETMLGSNDDSYWENRYEIVSCRMPIFLSRFSDKIMKTGKYLTVIRECKKEIGESPECELLVYTIEDRVYAERIDIAYNYASEKLLHFLLNESDLIAHLNSVKHYFFMDKGDFIVLFMDMAEDELNKEIDDIVPTRLTSLLELAVRTSVMSNDPHADLLGIELLNDSVLCQLSQILSHGTHSLLGHESSFEESQPLKGFESLAFKYKVEWPLSLILNQRNIACYQMLFRHLFYCKYVERQLERVWKDNKITKNYALEAFKGYSEAFCLRQKMLNFVQNLEYYMMVEVIEPNFHTFLQKVNTRVNSVDDMINEHTIFMEGCLQDCMLTQKVALGLMVKLLRLCMDFAEFMHKSQQYSCQFEIFDTNEQRLKANEFKAIKEGEEQNITNLPSFRMKIKQLHQEFNISLQQILNEIINQQNDHYTGKMLHILYRLDFNEYYGKMNNGYSNH